METKNKQDEIESVQNTDNELPLQFQISFEKVAGIYHALSDRTGATIYKQAQKAAKNLANIPELKKGFDDFTLLEKYKKELDCVLEPLFPSVLSDSEIKAAGLPFLFHLFSYSPKLETILEENGNTTRLKIRDISDDELFVRACMMILNEHYGYHFDFQQPIYLDIPAKENEWKKHYKLTIDSTFSEIIPTSHAPKITNVDFRDLKNSIDNVDYWKEKFPPGSYIFKGFSLFNFSDFTEEQEQMVFNEELLKNKDDKLDAIEQSLKNFLHINELNVGYSVFNLTYQNTSGSGLEARESLFLSTPEVQYQKYFDADLAKWVFQDKKMFTIAQMEQYRAEHPENTFCKTASEKNIQSVIFIPFEFNSSHQLVLIELASHESYRLNLLVQQRLNSIRPILEASFERIVKRFESQINLAIQEECTTIHPSVKWKFRKAAINFLNNKQSQKSDVAFEEIVFENVHPLYGQTDVRGSSEARNIAGAKDLTIQLKLIKNILAKIKKSENQSDCDEYLAEVNQFLKEIQEEFRVDTEAQIIQLVNKKTDQLFNRMRKKHRSLEKDIQNYFSKVDSELGTVYHYRKKYDQTISLINKRMAALLDLRQQEAQRIYPHFFERYKTDGVEHSMYIGESIAANKRFESQHLHNIRLWQLQIICETENEFYNNKQNYPLQLEVASMVFVFNKTIHISFVTDEKQFDVHGTYNARYEVIKKRIDKATVKGTKKRVTEPGYISIIYSHEEDKKEYLNYIHFLQSKGILNKEIEHLELEDLQDVTGLKAIKAGIVFSRSEDNSPTPEYFYPDD